MENFLVHQLFLASGIVRLPSSQNIIITSTILSAWYSLTFKRMERAPLWKMSQLSPEPQEEKMDRNLISSLNPYSDLIINTSGMTDLEEVNLCG